MVRRCRRGLLRAGVPVAFLALAANTQLAHSESVYRCKGTGGAPTYQQKPCDAGSSQATVTVKDPSPAAMHRDPQPHAIKGGDLAGARVIKERDPSSIVPPPREVTTPGGQAWASPSPTASTLPRCRLPWSSLPAQLEVIAVTAYGFPLSGFPIDASGTEASQIDAVVNAPGRDVALMLSARGPAVWNLRWTPTTRIHAVWASGFERNAVSGLPREAHVLETQQLTTAANSCGSFVWYGGSPEGFAGADTLSLMAFGRPVARMVDLRSPPRPTASGSPEEARPRPSVVIGPPLAPDTPTQTSNDRPPSAHADAQGARVGASALSALVRDGTLRPARRADTQAWRNAWLAKRDLPPVRDGRSRTTARFEKPDDPMRGAYVVQRAMAFPPPAPGAMLFASFIVPEGVPMPGGTVGQATVFDMKSLSCRGQGCPTEYLGHVHGDIPRLKASCVLPWADRKAPSRVYAAMVWGRPTGMLLEDETEPASVADVFVNDPGQDVGLMLVAADRGPRIWNVRWTPGTCVVAVYARGWGANVVQGLPPSAAVLTPPSDDKACPQVDLSAYGLTRINTAVRALFGQPATLAVIGFDSYGELHLGVPWAAGATLEGGVPGLHRDILTGGVADRIQVALEDAMVRGQIRRATQGDLRDHANAWRRQRGLTDVPDDGEDQRAVVPWSYLVLGRYELPSGMSESPQHRGSRFIVPRGTPPPDGARGGVVLIDSRQELDGSPPVLKAHLEAKRTSGFR